MAPGFNQGAAPMPISGVPAAGFNPALYGFPPGTGPQALVALPPAGVPGTEPAEEMEQSSAAKRRRKAKAAQTGKKGAGPIIYASTWGQVTVGSLPLLHEL